MNKFLAFSLFTFAFYFAPQAHATPSYWVAAYTEAYSGDASVGDQGVDNYTGYYCTVKSAQDMFGEGVYDVDTATSYFSTHYADGLTALKANASVDGGVSGVGQLTVRDFENGQYGLKATYGDSLVGSEFLAVLFYDADSDNAAFRVMANDPETMQSLGSALFSDKALASVGDVGPWTAVPEPTSALLLLLGVAGLALKRKQK